jgi:hypothetical protein
LWKEDEGDASIKLRQRKKLSKADGLCNTNVGVESSIQYFIGWVLFEFVRVGSLPVYGG